MALKKMNEGSEKVVFLEEELKGYIQRYEKYCVEDRSELMSPDRYFVWWVFLNCADPMIWQSDSFWSSQKLLYVGHVHVDIAHYYDRILSVRYDLNYRLDNELMKSADYLDSVFDLGRTFEHFVSKQEAGCKKNL